MYRAITENIEVTVEPFYLEEQSSPDESRYVWAYRVTIINHSDIPVQLRSRTWKITDAHGRTEEVRGPGVVGEEPFLKPGDSYQYSSGCPLTTSSGMMSGSYMMQNHEAGSPDEGKLFPITIPAFSLDMPGHRPVLN
ncbi:Co2+/Mg2+ efflux protein ApaG [Pseudochrobactrum algeriensis]|uniref:Protein ApaG n=1 Tax=Pseudochrobactrum saccharolyticum TaxID=354352 RepID=A0A7W8AG79_9HYPH|nr:MULTISPECIES: Co2+/Mg2+ efflux protein ApaG [Pseudochrobactrum]MBX8784019.1 Co2+/Mg2+ efflux protein ApaG [Ochrobactrum sp. GRS2]MBX8812088.1 Co2+/Mg2+ efflux protein ApaG [Ochrobactrum sp. MR34]KAB0540284.1 Co2+/Mg2+ efflux protein ApaG [Pseudochrobactrum saccharolyticum]MBB5089802.1 ApaG protein [Pseudochrobactrum saccharolyticum]QVQ37368.1 Co2+/Mg2+ efflux protein ApaG [Pseudochrobactrum algeriensis]